jgi:hypothetical protein
MQRFWFWKIRFLAVDRFSVFQNPKNFTAGRFLLLQNQKLDGGEDFATGQCERAFNKLSRTFAAQVETLKRYRGGGEQTMLRGNAGRAPAVFRLR